MGKCVKNLTISVIMAIISVFSLNGPVFATAQSTPTYLESSTQSVVTTLATPVENPDEEEEEETPQDESDSSTCYDQVGGIGWLVCPGTSFLANVIDGAYDILETLIKVDPISTDEKSPIRVVWQYLRNITNVVFIIFLLVVIYSQLTGFGINNYGIKKVLPRIIVSAILVNLSFVICILAVDHSAASLILFSNRPSQIVQLAKPPQIHLLQVSSPRSSVLVLLVLLALSQSPVAGAAYSGSSFQ